MTRRTLRRSLFFLLLLSAPPASGEMEAREYELAASVKSAQLGETVVYA